MSKVVSSMPLIAVLLFIRDARSTKGAQRELLYALALRSNPSKGYICWPSYAQLAIDTGLTPITLKRAANALEVAGYIKRIVRPNRSNRFFLNMEKIQTEALANRAADSEARAAKQAADAETSPFNLPSVVDEPDTDDATGDDDVDHVAAILAKAGAL
jgi:DNA-binding MarR family transcriptional regulator